MQIHGPTSPLHATAASVESQHDGQHQRVNVEASVGNAQVVASTLPPPSIPAPRITEDEANGAQSVANFLLDLDLSANTTDSDTMVARFLKMVVLQQAQDGEHASMAADAVSTLNEIAIAAAKQMSKRQYKDMGTSLGDYVNDAIDFKIESNARRLERKHDERFETMLNSQKEGRDAKRDLERKSEHKFGGAGGSGNDVVLSESGMTDIVVTDPTSPAGALLSGALDVTPEGVHLRKTREAHKAAAARQEAVAHLLMNAAENAMNAAAGRLAQFRS